MCGIAGIIAKTTEGKTLLSLMQVATDSMAHRGPDGSGVFVDAAIALGHRRLSIIDTTSQANQPMYDCNGRFVIVFNGEFFNFQYHREKLLAEGVIFNNHSDTEVLLQLYIKHGPKCVEYVNGFFALAIYDTISKEVFIARDRYGVKPLWIYENDNNIMFASELKALMAMGIPRTIDFVSLRQYLQLNYTVAPHTIFSGVQKMDTASYIHTVIEPLGTNKIWLKQQSYYRLNVAEHYNGTYDNACKELRKLLTHAVQRRLVADVPLGAFLSGGIDSSIICAIAATMVTKFHTFSIGFRDEKFYDETSFANLVAKKIGTQHTVFSLSNDDLFAHLFQMLDSIDEPFADSSALAVYILSKETRKHVTVALSGDGADEIFGGYNKHAAVLRAQQKSVGNFLLKHCGSLLNRLPQSRGNFLANKVRQLTRYSTGLQLDDAQRYYRWAALASNAEADALLLHPYYQPQYHVREAQVLRHFSNTHGLQATLRTDIDLVLQNDMLVKVDMMSMANSLEVRNPFMDYTVVDFAFSLPRSYKITSQQRKRVLKDAFRDMLPPEIYNRGKHGFEVPLIKWMRHELYTLIFNDLLAPAFIREQQIFHVEAIETLKKQLFSAQPGDATARIWALVVFQYWYKKHMN